MDKLKTHKEFWWSFSKEQFLIFSKQTDLLPSRAKVYWYWYWPPGLLYVCPCHYFHVVGVIWIVWGHSCFLKQLQQYWPFTDNFWHNVPLGTYLYLENFLTNTTIQINHSELYSSNLKTILNLSEILLKNFGTFEPSSLCNFEALRFINVNVVIPSDPGPGKLWRSYQEFMTRQNPIFFISHHNHHQSPVWVFFSYPADKVPDPSLANWNQEEF